jgi:hypothetical protein
MVMVFHAKRATETLPRRPQIDFTFAEKAAWIVDLNADEVKTAKLF